MTVKELRLNAEEMERIRILRKEYREGVKRLDLYKDVQFFYDVRDRRDRAIRSLSDDGFSIAVIAKIFRMGKKSTESVILDVPRVQG